MGPKVKRVDTSLFLDTLAIASSESSEEKGGKRRVMGRVMEGNGGKGDKVGVGGRPCPARRGKGGL